MLQRSRAFSIAYQNYALNSERSGVNKNQPEEIVVSLTTFDKRIHEVYLTIESLFQQSKKADRIVLWVSKQDFSNNDIPEILRLQMKRGLEIEFCDQDLGPFTKIYYALKKYPSSLIITVDDDIIYPLDMIDVLYKSYQKNPNMIHCHRAHSIRLAQNGELLPYKQWQWNVQNTEPSHSIFPTGVGGVLYFPGCFDEEVFNKEAYLELSPTADDVWLKAMSLKKGIICKKTDDGRDWSLRFTVVEGSQKFSLKRMNKQKNTGNDNQIKAVFGRYNLKKNLY